MSTTLATTVIDTPIGALTLFASDHGLRAVLWPGDGVERVRLDDAEDRPDHPVLVDAANQLDEYFAGSRTEFDLPLDAAGTEFQQAAWAALRRIPFGETATYGQQATVMGRPTAVRAVGAANGRNPLSIIVPCHRVIGADGSLVGFAAGIEVKRRLLDHERAVLAAASAE